MNPGTLTTVSAGSLQGIYRPQVRFYYHNARHGLLFQTFTKPLRCRSRARAITLAKEWMRTGEFAAILSEAKDRIGADPENTIA